MSEQPGNGGKVRSVAYLLLAVIAAVAAPSPDVLSMLLPWLAGVALFEVAFFVYRRHA